MIGRLVGKAIESTAEGGLLLDLHGVGYEISAPIGTLGRASVDANGNTTLHIHTHVREDALILFGFATEADRSAFRKLISVASIGPRTALAILGVLPLDELAHAVENGDLARIVRVPGIGKKTAERIVLELKGKLEPTSLSTSHRPSQSAKTLVAQALTSLGFRPADADRAVASLGEQIDQKETGDLVRQALAFLSQ